MLGPNIQRVIDMFAARFQPGGEYHLYFHNDSSGGVPCTAQEAEELVREYARIVRRAIWGMLVWMFVVVVVFVAIEMTMQQRLADWELVAVMAVPIAFMMRALQRASDAPLDAFKMRAAVTPSVDPQVARQRRLAATPMNFAFLLVAINALLGWQIRKDGINEDDFIFLGVIAVNVILVVAIVRAKADRS